MENDSLVGIISLTFSSGVMLLFVAQQVFYRIARRKYTSEELWALIHKLEEGIRAEHATDPALKNIGRINVPLSILDHKYETNFNVILFCRDKEKPYTFNDHVAFHIVEVINFYIFKKESRKQLKFMWFFYFESLSRMPLHLNDVLPRRIIAEWRLELGK